MTDFLRQPIEKIREVQNRLVAEQVALCAEGHEYYRAVGLRVADNNRLLAFGEDTLSRRIYTLRIKDLEFMGNRKEMHMKQRTASVAGTKEKRTKRQVKKEKAKENYLRLGAQTTIQRVAQDSEPLSRALSLSLSQPKITLKIAATARQRLPNTDRKVSKIQET